jgi:hypothetical protein
MRADRFQQLRRDERGMSFVFVAVSFMALFAATTIAIDVGMFMTARGQSQNAADAGALAGATALVFNDYENRSADGPAVQSAINTAQENEVMRGTVSVQPGDVTFPLGPTGLDNRVRVNVFRTADRSNPVATLIGPIFGIDTVDVSTTATAEASPANAMSCVKPFTIPDRWIENSAPGWDPETSTFDKYDNHGNLLPAAMRDVYIPADEAGHTGYDAWEDRGLLLTIRAGTGNNVAPSFYWSWAMPGGTGGDWYRENIAGCNGTLMHFGDAMIQEPGNMVGPTNQGIDELMAQDMGAYWDFTTRSVVSTRHPSPRVFPIPVYDPEVYADGQQSGRGVDLRMANWIGFFLEGRDGNNVYGRITPITGWYDGNAGPAPVNSFPKVIRLVQ